MFGMGYVLDIHNFTYYLMAQILNGLAQSTGWPAVVPLMGNWFGLVYLFTHYYDKPLEKCNWIILGFQSINIYKPFRPIKFSYTRMAKA